MQHDENRSFGTFDHVRADSEPVSEVIDPSDGDIPFDILQLERRAFRDPVDAVRRSFHICRAYRPDGRLQGANEKHRLSRPTGFVALACAVPEPCLVLGDDAGMAFRKHHNPPDTQTLSTLSKARLSVSVSAKKAKFSMFQRLCMAGVLIESKSDMSKILSLH